MRPDDFFDDSRTPAASGPAVRPEHSTLTWLRNSGKRRSQAAPMSMSRLVSFGSSTMTLSGSAPVWTRNWRSSRSGWQS
jgi:hypothetical protein